MTATLVLSKKILQSTFKYRGKILPCGWKRYFGGGVLGEKELFCANNRRCIFARLWRPPLPSTPSLSQILFRPANFPIPPQASFRTRLSGGLLRASRS